MAGVVLVQRTLSVTSNPAQIHQRPSDAARRTCIFSRELQRQPVLNWVSGRKGTVWAVVFGYCSDGCAVIVAGR